MRFVVHICTTAAPQPEKPTYPVIVFREPVEKPAPLVKGRSVRFGVFSVSVFLAFSSIGWLANGRHCYSPTPWSTRFPRLLSLPFQNNFCARIVKINLPVVNIVHDNDGPIMLCLLTNSTLFGAFTTGGTSATSHAMICRRWMMCTSPC